MDEQLKRRLVGAAIIIATAVIVVPFFFEDKAPKDASELPDVMDAKPLVLPKQEAASGEQAPASESQPSAAHAKKRKYEMVSLDEPSKPASESPSESGSKHAAAADSGEDSVVQGDEGAGALEEPPQAPAPRAIVQPRPAAPKVAPVAPRPKPSVVVSDEPLPAPKRVETPPPKPKAVEPQAAHKPAAQEPAPAVKKPQVAPPAVSKPVTVAQAPLKPVTAAPKAPAPQSASQPPQAAMYTVQAGTFNDETNASTLVDKLKKRNLPARLIAIEGPNGKVYRVTVGSKLDHGKAEQIQKQLATQDGLKGLIMPTR
jgi:DedD protein